MAARGTRTTAKPAAGKLVVAATSSRSSAPKKIGEARLRELIEEATVDAYGESEQQTGFLTMIQEHLSVPFETTVLGVPVRVTKVDFNDADEIVAICRRGALVQRIPVLDLPLPKPLPEGFEWIEAYRAFKHGKY